MSTSEARECKGITDLRWDRGTSFACEMRLALKRWLRGPDWPPRITSSVIDRRDEMQVPDVTMVVVAGIDGCRKGWLCLTKNLATGTVHAQIFARIDEVLSLEPRPGIVTVDVPIGLTDSGPRLCELEARKQLGAPRSSSVIPAPVRSTLVATSYPEACRLGHMADGRKLSQQAWRILPKIVEVDTLLRSKPSLQAWIREVHPEVSFWAWNGNNAMKHPKKSSAGRVEREGLIVPRYGPAYSAAQSNLPRGWYANDDLLDAFAALWSAERVHAGLAIVFPPNPPTDSCGLKMEMVA